MWMRGRLGQDVFDDALGQFSAVLVLLQNNADKLAGPDIAALCAIHRSAQGIESEVGVAVAMASHSRSSYKN